VLARPAVPPRLFLTTLTTFYGIAVSSRAMAAAAAAGAERLWSTGLCVRNTATVYPSC